MISISSSVVRTTSTWTTIGTASPTGVAGILVISRPYVHARFCHVAIGRVVGPWKLVTARTGRSWSSTVCHRKGLGSRLNPLSIFECGQVCSNANSEAIRAGVDGDGESPSGSQSRSKEYAFMFFAYLGWGLSLDKQG